MRSQEELLALIKKRTMERIVFTRTVEPFKVSVEELPPFIPNNMRAEVVVNSEVEKNSALLISPTINGMISCECLFQCRLTIQGTVLNQSESSN